MVTLSLYLDQRRKLRRGYPIMMTIRANGKSAMMGTGCYIQDPELFTGDGYNAVKSTHPDSYFINTTVSAMYMRLQKWILERNIAGELDNYSPSEIFSAACGGVKSPLFLDYYLEKISVKSSSTKEAYMFTYKMLLKEYGNKLLVKNINDIWVQHLENWMLKRKLKDNTRANHHRHISAVLRDAVRDKIIKQEQLPYGPFGFHIKSGRKDEIDCLSVEELRELWTAPTVHSTKPFSRQNVAKDLFFLSFMLGGINLHDLYTLEKSNIVNGILRTKRVKTGVPISMTIPPEAWPIIRKYESKKDSHLLRFSYDNGGEEGYNDFMQAISSAIRGYGRKLSASGKVHKLSFYYARYTFSGICDELEIHDAVVERSLGHANSSMLRKHYSTVGQKRVDDAIRKVLDYVGCFPAD